MVRAHLLNLLGGEWLARAIYVAAKLDVAHHLLEGAKSGSDLARLLQVEKAALSRLLSMLSSSGIFQEIEEDVFINSPISERLAHDHPHTLRSLVIFYGEEVHHAFGFLLHSVKTGKTGFDEAYGKSSFAYFKSNPERKIVFHSAMQEKSNAVIQSIIDQVPFRGVVCDVGGGSGHLLRAIMNHNPALEGILFDLPEVIDAIETAPAKIKMERGSFFDAVPKADVYLMKSILHDWNDQESIQILQRCRESMPPGAVLYVIEPLISSADSGSYARLTDLLMLAVTGGKERTLDQFKALFSQGGFDCVRVVSTSTEYFVLEAHPRIVDSEKNL